MEKQKGKIVLIYAHENRDFLKASSKRTAFLDFLEGLGSRKKLDFWWDEKISETEWDKEIKRQLNDADIILCLVSEPFLNSIYVKKVELRIARARQKKEGIIVVPILLEASTWEKYSWLRKWQHLPDKPIRPYYNHNRAGIYLEIVEHIENRIDAYLKGRPQRKGVKVYREPRMLSAIRRLPTKELQRRKKQLNELVLHAKEQADRLVPDLSVQDEICKAGKRLLKTSGVRSLSKEQLEHLDREVLMERDGRERPDAKKVRWVLRAHRLHPQGRS
jgi:hypothetical protein